METYRNFARLVHVTLVTLVPMRAATARRRTPNDAGASAVEWVIITAVIITIAGVVGAILLNTIRGAAERVVVP